MINFLLLHLPLAWFLARALRHPGTPRCGRWWHAWRCVTVDGPWVMPAVRSSVGPSAARWFFDAALTGSWAALARFEQQRRPRAEAVVPLGMSEPPPARVPARFARWARDRVRALRRREVLDIEDWALDHHVDWDRQQR